MAIETQSEADIKFQAGNYNEACTIYGEELLALDASQSKRRIELLQKLGDSLQGAGRNLESVCIFEQLLKCQVDNECKETDKIITYLRLGKAHYLCEQQREAEIEFKTAYKLAKSLLPPTHVLQGKVAGCYADWLQKTAGDASLLANLKNELKSADAVSGTAIETTTTQGVLVSRSEAPKRRKTSAPTSQDLDMKVAADLLSNEIEIDLKNRNVPVTDLQPDFGVGGSTANFSQPASGSRASVPLSASKGDSDQNSLRDWSNLPIRSETSMRGSSRSYFKDGTHSTAEIDKLMLEQNSWTKRLGKSLPIVIGAALFGLVVTSAVNEPSSKELPTVFLALVGKTFATTDNTLSLTASNAGFIMRGHGLKKLIKPIIWKGSFSDEIRLLKGEYNKCIWLTPISTGLQDQTGLKFWDETSEESKTIKAMGVIAAGAQSFYQNNGRYPLPAEAKSLFTYRNPCTNVIEPVQAYSAISYHPNAATRNERLEVHIQRGELFEKESTPKAGTVAMLSIINKPNGLIELPNQRVECQVAYLHAFDRNGQLINCPTSDKTLLISLFKGVTDRFEDTSIVERYSNATLCVSPGSAPSSGAIFLKYVGCFLLIVALALYLLRIRQTAGKEESF